MKCRICGDNQRWFQVRHGTDVTGQQWCYGTDPSLWPVWPYYMAVGILALMIIFVLFGAST